MTTPAPIRVALIDDYEVVLAGLAAMLKPYAHRIEIAEIDANAPLSTNVDIALCDSFARAELDYLDVLIDNPRARHLVIYSWNLGRDIVREAIRRGAHGYLTKALPARDLVAALEAVHRGEIVVSADESSRTTASGSDWPGRIEGLSEREAEIVALITQGKSNDDIAKLTFLSPNTVKSYVRNTYRKIGVNNRTQAALWGVAHGFSPNHSSIAPWRSAWGDTDGQVRGGADGQARGPRREQTARNSG